MENSKSEFNCYLVHVQPLLGRKQKFLPLFEEKLQKQTDLPKQSLRHFSPANKDVFQTMDSPFRQRKSDFYAQI